MALTLRVRIEDKNVVKAMQFEPHTAVLDACRMIRERLPDAGNINNREWSLSAIVLSAMVPGSAAPQRPARLQPCNMLFGLYIRI